LAFRPAGAFVLIDEGEDFRSAGLRPAADSQVADRVVNDRVFT